MLRQGSQQTDHSDEAFSTQPSNRSHQQRPQNGYPEPDWTPTKNGSGAEQASHESDPPSKRRRVALACTVCRGRKSRVSDSYSFYFCL
jgi:hypothetical protein